MIKLNLTFSETVEVSPGTAGGTISVLVVQTGVPVYQVIGTGGALQNIVTSQNVLKGQPLYVSRSNGLAGVADAAVYTQSFVVGFANADTLSGFAAPVTNGVCTLTDWTSIAGTATLSAGQPYFLATGGGITLTAPDKSTAQALVCIGTAITTATLDFDPDQPILL